MSVVVPKEETFDNYKLIDRKPFANYLTAFLNTKAEEGYVINLNAEWELVKQRSYNAGTTNFPKNTQQFTLMRGARTFPKMRCWL